ncbi:hypothetical protein [Cupriavidus sp. BIC8F]|uniref:hypothetical protein n=1 Tax=Cupriavidus sp. BIC8F TaxID=3079014 RepID=UPI002916E365|nr:hypothetical protein [Cupriavidus sp. BIC8F]
MHSLRIGALSIVFLLWHGLPLHAEPLPAEPARAGLSAPGGFGAPVNVERLASARGGADQVENDINVRGNVANNSARNVRTGDNVITGGSFAGANGLVSVVQNSGANVLIQNSTIVNIQFKP